jgi:hypothetical protein
MSGGGVSTERKTYPLATGCIDYFPDALMEVARVSHAGNEQHNPGEPLRWDRSKSADEADALMRHFIERGTRDTDGQRHSAKVAWRALAFLQKEIESERAAERVQPPTAVDRLPQTGTWTEVAGRTEVAGVWVGPGAYAVPEKMGR